MGCDIHFYVEVRKDGAWTSADKWTQDKYSPDRLSVAFKDHMYDGRNYSLFAILADVRNSHDFMPICDPKGLPDDMSPLLAAEAQDYDHSASWHTLADLLAFDWTQTVTMSGWVHAVEYARWQRSLRWEPAEGPKEYCGMVGGADVRHLTTEQMDTALAALTTRDPDEIKEAIQQSNLRQAYVNATWDVPYYKECRCFLSDIIPQLLRLGAPDDVRIVFWFDS